MKFGIVQGRLTPSTELQCFPENWEKEFHYLPDIGLHYIELVADREVNKNNPLWNYREPISNPLCKELDVWTADKPILCNDYVINHSLDDELAARLWTYRLIEQANLIGSELIVLPLFEHSYSTSKDTILEIELYAARNNVQIALETCENDYPFKLVYDTGNRVTEGINLAREIKELNGKISHVHIKDKDEAGNNVLLGTGMVNFKEVCQAFVDIGYDKTMTFETVRGKDPIKTAKYNLEFIKFFLSEAQ